MKFMSTSDIVQSAQIGVIGFCLTPSMLVELAPVPEVALSQVGKPLFLLPYVIFACLDETEEVPMAILIPQRLTSARLTS